MVYRLSCLGYAFDRDIVSKVDRSSEYMELYRFSYERAQSRFSVQDSVLVVFVVRGKRV